MIHRHATAVWKGALKEGHGTVSTESGLLSETSYSFARRFEGEPGTNPEELIAAAHASCYAMALSSRLGQEGAKPERIKARATVTLDKNPEGFAVTEIQLDVQATIPGMEESQFQKLAAQAKETCPISRLMNAKITLAARLES